MSDETASGGAVSALNDSIRKLDDTISSLRTEMVSTYVRKDVYEAEKKALTDTVDGIVEQRRGEHDWRRNMNLQVLALVVSNVVAIIVAFYLGRH